MHVVYESVFVLLVEKIIKFRPRYSEIECAKVD